MRGSLKHVFDLGQRPDFPEVITDLLKNYVLAVSGADNWQPNPETPAESELVTFCRTHLAETLGPRLALLENWWVPYRRPQWDLLSTCTIESQPGLLMVEAKANDKELKPKGKKAPKDSAKREKHINHAIIGECIREACDDLKCRFGGFGISRDSHYQLSNRVAYAWKAAQCGLPVVLLYLGFTGDDGIADAGEPIRDAGHWDQVMGGYMAGIVPESFLGEVVLFPSGGSMRMVIAAMECAEVSSPVKKDQASQKW